MGGLRKLAAPFVALGPSGVAVRDRLKQLTAEDEHVLRLVGDHLGALASRDLTARCAVGLDHDSGGWAARKRAVTGVSSSRWAGSITQATHDQWALARRGQLTQLNRGQMAAGMVRHDLRNIRRVWGELLIFTFRGLGERISSGWHQPLLNRWYGISSGHSSGRMFRNHCRNH
jgi:hypothetical protein